MNKLYLKPIEDNELYDWSVELGDLLDNSMQGNIAICGNDRFIELGSETIRNILKGDYYDNNDGYNYKPKDKLKELYNVEFERFGISGYSQGEWNNVCAPKDTPRELIKEIENYYFGRIRIVENEDGEWYVIPDDVAWRGKDAICEYLGYSKEDTIVFEPTNRRTVYDWQEM